MAGLLSKLLKGKEDGRRAPIVIVSGLPRSGTSMMMKMLDAGGLPPLTDNERTADEDNPKGYFEFERVKKLETDKEWLRDAEGKAVKVISMLLRHLPSDHAYKVIFMHRTIDEILASQRRMLIRRGEPTDKVPDEKMAEMYRTHLRKIEKWLDEQGNFDVLYVTYNDALKRPVEYCEKVNTFLGGALDESKMAGVVDNNLYRQRKATKQL